MLGHQVAGESPPSVPVPPVISTVPSGSQGELRVRACRSRRCVRAPSRCLGLALTRQARQRAVRQRAVPQGQLGLADARPRRRRPRRFRGPVVVDDLEAPGVLGLRAADQSPQRGRGAGRADGSSSDSAATAPRVRTDQPRVRAAAPRTATPASARAACRASARGGGRRVALVRVGRTGRGDRGVGDGSGSVTSGRERAGRRRRQGIRRKCARLENRHSGREVGAGVESPSGARASRAGVGVGRAAPSGPRPAPGRRLSPAASLGRRERAATRPAR